MDICYNASIEYAMKDQADHSKMACRWENDMKIALASARIVDRDISYDLSQME